MLQGLSSRCFDILHLHDGFGSGLVALACDLRQSVSYACPTVHDFLVAPEGALSEQKRERSETSYVFFWMELYSSQLGMRGLISSVFNSNSMFLITRHRRKIRERVLKITFIASVLRFFSASTRSPKLTAVNWETIATVRGLREVCASLCQGCARLL